MVTILDYGIGNVRSINNALVLLGLKCQLSNSYKEILSSQALILPGVGSFEAGMRNLIAADLQRSISDFIESGKPVLGICLGMQLLFSIGHEFGTHKGLDLIKGEITKMNAVNCKLPHIGWNKIESIGLNSSLDGLNGQAFYFVHSFCAKPSNSNEAIAYCTYGTQKFCAAVKKDNITGVQFHPEKSGKSGLKLLQNFINGE